jgi:hypothetical protein
MVGQRDELQVRAEQAEFVVGDGEEDGVGHGLSGGVGALAGTKKLRRQLFIYFRQRCLRNNRDA